MLPTIRISFALIVCNIYAALVMPAQAQQIPLLPPSINDATRVTIPHSVHPLARQSSVVSAGDPNLKMDRMLLLLGPSAEQEKRLQRFLESQHDKSSPEYHHWLTPEQFGNAFGPSQQDIQTIRTWLEQQGFTVGATARSGRWMEFSGTAHQVEQAFATQMRRYQFAGQMHVANGLDISIPADLIPVVRGVVSLHDFFKKPMISGTMPLHRNSHGTYETIIPDFTSATGLHALGPADFSKIYDVPPAITGAGQTIAIVARENASGADVTDFQRLFGLPINLPQNTLVGPAPAGDQNDAVEATLDAEWSGAVAPGASIIVVVSGSTATTDGVDLSAAYIVDNNLASIVNVSFGSCEAGLGATENQFFNALWQQASAQGMSVIVAAGDNGAAGCDPVTANTPGTDLGVNGLASTEFDTAVGGTQFNDAANPSLFWSPTNGAVLSSVNGYIPEKVWNEACTPGTGLCGSGQYNLSAGSGGASSLYAKPDWQGLLPGMFPDQKRDLPDVSFTAATHDPYLICFQFSCEGANVSFLGVGGTSASAPAFAGIMALINSEAGGRQGLANHLLYQIASREVFAGCDSSSRGSPSVPASASCVFNDVTEGGNSVPGVVGFSATPGFDLVSGLGSVNVNNLVTQWKAITRASTTIALLSTTVFPVTHGQPVALNIKVSGTTSAAAPGGAAALTTDLGSPVGVAGSVSLTPNSASHMGIFNGTVTSLPGGTYTLAAHYFGDAANGPSDSNGIPITIKPEPSSATLQSFGTNSSGAVTPVASFPYGSDMILHAKVVGVSGHGVATGFVGFEDTADPSHPIGSASLDPKGEAEAALKNNNGTTVLAPGLHSLTMFYEGDLSFSPVTAVNPIAVTITKGNPVPRVAFVGDSYTSGMPFDVDVSAGATGPIAPTGTMQLFDNGLLVATSAPLINGGATISLTLDADGQHSLTTSYSGDNVYNSALSAAVVTHITPPFSVSLEQASSKTVLAGETVTFPLSVSTYPSFSGTINLTCSGAPAGTTCSVNPTSVNMTGNSNAPVTLTVATTLAARLHDGPFRSLPGLFCGILAGLVYTVKKQPRKTQRLFIVIASLVLGSVGCGGGGGSGSSSTAMRPPTTATITVTATSGQHSASNFEQLIIVH